MRMLAAAVCAALLAGNAAAAPHRAVAPPSSEPTGAQADILGIGSLTGSAVSGNVASVSGTLITLNAGDVPIRIDASKAKFVAGDGAASIADVKPGSRITAFVTPSPAASTPGPLVAQVIALEPQPPDLTISGTIDSVDVAGSRFVVLGITINVVASTRFSSDFPTFAPIQGIGFLAPGQTVRVNASANAAIIARDVTVTAPSRPSLITIHGTVKAASDTSWVITPSGGGDTTVRIDPQTKIVGGPAVGDEVEVIARSDSSDAYVAVLIIKVVTSAKIVIVGVVKSIGPTAWVITDGSGKDVTVGVDSKTEIVGSPAPGEMVNVIATRDGAGNLVATNITRLIVDPLMLRGFVHSIAADQWTIGGPPGSLAPEWIVKITATTSIYPNPAVGDSVAITGTRNGAVFIAWSIAKDTTAPSAVELHGVVQSMTKESWTLAGPSASPLPLVVKITSSTVIYADPKIGDHVVVSGTRDGSGTITALKIAKE